MSEVIDFGKKHALQEELDSYIEQAKINMRPSTLQEVRKELQKFQEYLLHHVADVDDNGNAVLSEKHLQYCDLLRTILEQYSLHEELDYYVKLAKINMKPSTWREAQKEYLKFQEYLLDNVDGIEDEELAVPNKRLLQYCDLLKPMLNRYSLHTELEHHIKLAKINIKPSNKTEAQDEYIKFHEYLASNVDGIEDEELAVPNERLLEYCDLLKSILNLHLEELE